MSTKDLLSSSGTGSDGGTAAPRQPADLPPLGLRGLTPYFLLGVLLGIVFVKSELASWFRIQEMFRFGSFHMYGLLASAFAVAAVSVALIERVGLRTVGGERIHMPPKALGTGTRYWAGGSIFGMGWALTGACPGPIFALIGSGIWPFAIVLVFAVAGMWTYGHWREGLPH